MGFFLVDEGTEDTNTTIIGPTSARQRNACRTYDGPILNASLWFFWGSGPVLLGNPIVLWFFMGEGVGGVWTTVPWSAHAYTHGLARAFTACLLKVVDIQVRKSTPSPKDVDCILTSYIAYQSLNKTQFCSMVIHVHHKSVHSEGSDELAHMRSLGRAFTVYCLNKI